MSTRAMACWALLGCASAYVLCAPVFANDQDAHSVADKFATEQDAANKHELDRKAEDARKRELELKADEARKEAARIKAEQMLKADQEKSRPKVKQQAKGPARPAKPDPAEEAEILARARSEEAAKQAAEEARVLAEQEATVERAKAELQASQIAEEERAKLDALAREAAGIKPTGTGADSANKANAEAERALADWMRNVENTRRVVQSLNRVREIRQQRLAAQARRQPVPERVVEAPPRPGERAKSVAEAANSTKPAAQAAGSSLDTTASHLGNEVPRTPDFAEPEKPDVATAELRRPIEKPSTGSAERVVTVLLVMAPGNYGIRKRGPKVADPLLCTTNGCYVSTGPGSPSVFLPGRKALGFGNTLGARAGACRQRLGCVFRGIDLEVAARYLQPVDMHIFKHDRRRGLNVEADSDCRVEAGRISCRRGTYAEDYGMWIIPEDMASTIGAEGLERTLEDGLAAPRAAELGQRPVR